MNFVKRVISLKQIMPTFILTAMAFAVLTTTAVSYDKYFGYKTIDVIASHVHKENGSVKVGVSFDLIGHKVFVDLQLAQAEFDFHQKQETLRVWVAYAVNKLHIRLGGRLVCEENISFNEKW